MPPPRPEPSEARRAAALERSEPRRMQPEPASLGSRSFGRDTLEFARVANLSDAVFAIAMTLLVLTIDVPRVPPGELAEALREQLGQLVAFLLSFSLVASVWWSHHRFLKLLDRLEPGLVGITLGMLALVALIPFPAGLIGQAPTDRAAVVPFVALFVLLVAAFLLMTLRAHRVGAWRLRPPPLLYGWIVTGWTIHLAMMALALLIAFAAPIVALVLAGLTGTIVSIVIGSLAPRAYGEWA